MTQLGLEFYKPSVLDSDICRNNHGGDLESVEAHRSTAKHADRNKILQHLRLGPDTCDRTEEVLGMRHQTCSARFSELTRDGLIVPTGKRAKTRTGCWAKVYQVTQ